MKNSRVMPKASVIVPTKNSAEFLEACLMSIRNQSYKNIELIVVDNFSTDDTPKIAKKYADKFLSKGPERTAQRNYATTKAKGEYIAFIDSDMEVGAKVIEQCVDASVKNVTGVIIHEKSFGPTFWAKCKALEKSFYVNVPWIEAARFFPAPIFRKLNGYNESLISGEDWDLSKRAEKLGSLVSIDEFIRHNEGNIKLISTLKKKYYYAKHAAAYLSANPEDSRLNSKVGPLNRYKLFFSQPVKLFKNPIIGIGMLYMKTSEFAFGAIGVISGKI